MAIDSELSHSKIVIFHSYVGLPEGSPQHPKVTLSEILLPAALSRAL